MTGAWDSIKLLGAVSDTGETFFLPCAENFNSDTTIRLLDALRTEFGERICVVLDNASYFTANKVQELVEETPIKLCYLPRGSPELNPAEECWRRLDKALGNQLFDTLDELRDGALTALDDIEPQMSSRTYVREYEALEKPCRRKHYNWLRSTARRGIKCARDFYRLTQLFHSIHCTAILRRTKRRARNSYYRV